MSKLDETSRKVQAAASAPQDEVTAARDIRTLVAFLDSIIDNIPAMVFVNNAETLRYERFNRAGEELTGLKRDNMFGHDDFSLFPSEQARFFQEKDREVLENKLLVDIPEEPFQTPNGVRWLHTRKIPILGPAGEPRYLLGISEDITDRKTAEERRLTAHRELERSVDERAAREHLAVLLLEEARLIGGEERAVVAPHQLLAREARELLARAVEALVAQRLGVLDEDDRGDVVDDRVEEAAQRSGVARRADDRRVGSGSGLSTRLVRLRHGAAQCRSPRHWCLHPASLRKRHYSPCLDKRNDSYSAHFPRGIGR